jgi:hypothetical protein
MPEKTNKPWWERILDAASKVNHKWVAWGVAVAMSLATTYYGCKPLPPIPDTPDEPFIVEDGAEGFAQGAPPEARVVYSGWRRDPEAVQAVQGRLPFKVFADTPAGRDDAPLPDHAYLWHAYRKIRGGNPPGKDQQDVGACVSFGTNTAIERTMACDIAGGGRFEFKFLCEEVTYAGSRVEVGRGRVRGDGSVNAWAAEFARKYGVVSRERHGAHDLTSYDPKRARDWGRTGCPDELEPLAREHPVEDFTQVRSWAEAKRALAQGCGIAVASDQGFSRRRDARGVARPQGSWMHSMCLDGYHVDADGREYGHVENSWGDDFFTGPTGWGDPGPSGFWADSKVIDRMLRQGDSWAFSAVKGFPARRVKLDWFVRRRPDPFPLALAR